MVIQKYVTEQNGSAFVVSPHLYLFITHAPASLTTFKKRRRPPRASPGARVKYNLATITTIRKRGT